MSIPRPPTEIEQIAEVKARYCRFLDTKDWVAFRDQFTDSAKIGPIESGIPNTPQIVEAISIDEFISRVQSRLEGVVSVHHGHMPEVEFDDEIHAHGTWAMGDILFFPEGAPMRRLQAYGHSHETYEKVDDRWRISSLALTRLHVHIDG